MKKYLKPALILLILLCAVLALSACVQKEESPAPQPTPAVTEAPAPAVTEAPTETAAPEPTATPVPKAGIVRGKVTDDNSNMIVATVIVEDAEGATQRVMTNAFGGYSLNLLPGDYKLTFTKGNEYSTVTKTVSVASLKTYYLPDARLTALYDSYAAGWVAGDLHAHTYYSDGVDSVTSAMIGNAANGIYFGFLTDHNTSRGVPEWTGASKVNVRTGADGQPRYFAGFDGVEVTTEFGHYNSLGSGLTLETYDVKLREAERSSKDKLTFIRDKVLYIADCITRIGGLAQVNHPYSSTTMGTANWIEATDYEVYDLFDTMEIWNGYFVPPDGIYDTQNAMNQNYSAKLLWYSLLREMKNGHPFITATGGTDNHDTAAPVSAKMHEKYTASEPSDLEGYYNYWVNTAKYNGMPANYVFLNGQDVTMENVMAAVKAGHSFISDDPVVICDIGGAVYGDTVPAKGEQTLTINTNIWNRDGLREIRVVVNGEVVKTVELDGTVTSYDAPIEVEGNWESRDFILLEVLGPVTQYAITNPFIIE